jgi:hypothetical protein
VICLEKSKAGRELIKILSTLFFETLKIHSLYLQRKHLVYNKKRKQIFQMVIDSLGLIIRQLWFDNDCRKARTYIIDESENTNGHKIIVTCLIYIILVKIINTL